MSRSAMKEVAVFANETEASDFLNKLGSTAIWYFDPEDSSSFTEAIDAAFEEDPEAHLELLDDYRILDVDATLAARDGFDARLTV